jgi:cobyrinic acid a,c-diamide synthase
MNFRMMNNTPKIMIAALKGGSGKTVITTGLASALIRRDLRIRTYKKGPDFIDSGWLSFASRNPCYNLDQFLMDDKAILDSIADHSSGFDVSIIEGNRGLYDGMDVDGRYSSAELAKLTETPVIIVVDITMSSRTVAALIMGCQHFDPELDIRGVILNRVANPRQENIVTRSIENHCNIKVLGSIPRLKESPFPERHMGLIPHFEINRADKAVKWAVSLVNNHIDIDLIQKIAQESAHLPGFFNHNQASARQTPCQCRIGIVKDDAFWFYYPENIDLLKELGAEIIEINSLKDSHIPEIDALYIGGGFPEIYAEQLAMNSVFRASLKHKIEHGLPVYAECGGLLYLGQCIETSSNSYPMVGALPIRFCMEKKPQGHGYTILKVTKNNPYYKTGEIIKGHEFHYSRPVFEKDAKIDTVFEVERGFCLDGKKDGLIKNNLFATYTHIHAAGNRGWGEAVFSAAIKYRRLLGDINKPLGQID